MPRDYYAEEIGNVATASTQDYYAEEIDNQPKNKLQQFSEKLNATPEGRRAAIMASSLAKSPFGRLALMAMGKKPQEIDQLVAAVEPQNLGGGETAIKIGSDITGSAPLFGLTNAGIGGMLPKLPNLLKLATSAGVTAGTEKSIEGKPEEAIGTGLATTAGTAALGYGGKYIAKGIPKLPTFFKNLVTNVKNVKNPVAFSQKVRKELFTAKSEVGKAVEQGIEQVARNNPTQSIDLSASFNNIKGVMDNTADNPGLASVIKGIINKVKNPEQAKLLKDLIDDPAKATNLTLKQVQDIKVAIRNSPTIASKLKQGKFANWEVGDLELLDLVDNIRVEQLRAFPELSEVFKPYATYMGNYNQVKNMFKPSTLLNKLRQGFGNEEIEAMVKAVVPKETTKAISGFRSLDKIKRNIPKAVGLGIGAEGARRVIEKVTK